MPGTLVSFSAISQLIRTWFQHGGAATKGGASQLKEPASQPASGQLRGDPTKEPASQTTNQPILRPSEDTVPGTVGLLFSEIAAHPYLVMYLFQHGRFWMVGSILDDTRRSVHVGEHRVQYDSLQEKDTIPGTDELRFL